MADTVRLQAEQTYQEQAENQKLFREAEKLRKEYRFRDAIDIYKSISDSSASITNSIAISENGISLLNYAAQPTVTGKVTLPLSDFFLYTPGMGNRLWTEAPENFNAHGLLSDSLRSESPNPMIYTPGKTVLYFSVQETGRGWSIYSTTLIDNTTWSAPEPLNDLVNSTGDEILPHISRDGKELYFASNGHPGIGGFDLYVSRWDEKTDDWGLPQNLGFPYSSTEDDFLFINDENGLHSYLFSNRNSSSDNSATIYRLDYEPSPIRRPISSVEEAISIAALNPVSGQKSGKQESSINTILTTNPETQEYVFMIMEVRDIRKSIDSLASVISANRESYLSLTDEEERKALVKLISEQELESIEKQALLSDTNRELQKKEMEFLTKGTIIPRDIAQLATSEQETPEKSEAFRPIKAGWGSLPYMNFSDPVRRIDYTFRIGEDPEIIEETDMPAGLIYRVQLFLVRDKAQPSAFKKISPVFESKTSTSRWLYSAGQFYSEQEASAALAQVKRAGFPNAILTAYNDGKSIPISTARNLVKRMGANVSYQITLENFPEGLPRSVLDILRENTEKDIAKSIIDGKEVYIVGPFSNKAEADQLILLLTNAGTDGVSLQEINSDK